MCWTGAAENHWYAQSQPFSAAFQAAWLERFILTPEPAKNLLFFFFFFFCTFGARLEEMKAK